MHDTDRGRFKNFHKIFKRPRCVCRRSEICTIYECESSNSISSAGEKSLMLFPKIKVFSIFNPHSLQQPSYQLFTPLFNEWPVPFTCYSLYHKNSFFQDYFTNLLN